MFYLRFILNAFRSSWWSNPSRIRLEKKKQHERRIRNAQWLDPTGSQALPLPYSPVPIIFCLFSPFPFSLPLPREISHSPYRWYVLLLWRIYWWMHCFTSRYPGAHRSYGSFLILPWDSDEQELNNFVLPFKFPFFFLILHRFIYLYTVLFLNVPSKEYIYFISSICLY